MKCVPGRHEMIIRSNSLYIPLKNESVHCVITSPPYWGLRNYQVNGQLGLEKTPEEYVQNMVMVGREIWRVLCDDGTLWLNMGDSYWGGGGGNYGNPIAAQHGQHLTNVKNKYCPDGLKPKDLCGIPWRLAFALQAEGWYLRSDIVWSKLNPMPESVTDRPTKSHEYIFLLSKSPHYFFDQEAVREPDKGTDHWRGVIDGQKSLEPSGGLKGPHRGIRTPHGRNGTGRNIRTVWNIATQPFSGAHFATFPEELVRRCLFAGTSEKGCCLDCGKPWVRIKQRIDRDWDGSKYGERVVESTGGAIGGGTSRSTLGSSHGKLVGSMITVGWKPSCTCNGDCPDSPVPCIVFDPFFGAGTVGVVAQKYNRRFVGLELKPEYCQMAQNRVNSQPVAMI